MVVPRALHYRYTHRIDKFDGDGDGEDDHAHVNTTTSFNLPKLLKLTTTSPVATHGLGDSKDLIIAMKLEIFVWIVLKSNCNVDLVT